MILAEKFGVKPRVILASAPIWPKCWARPTPPCSSATPPFASIPPPCPLKRSDLGAEWVSMTGLPMVFAVWAGRKEIVREPYGKIFLDSCRYGLAHMDDIVAAEAPARAVHAGRWCALSDTPHRIRAGGTATTKACDLYMKHALRLDRAMRSFHMMTRAEAIDMFHSDDLIGIGMAADAVRRKLHPEGVVSYIIDRNINYTNFCTEYCSFCAFYRPMGHAEGYVHPHEIIFRRFRKPSTWAAPAS